MKYEVNTGEDEVVEVVELKVSERSVKELIALIVVFSLLLFLSAAAIYGMYVDSFTGLSEIWNRAEPIAYTLVGYCVGKSIHD